MSGNPMAGRYCKHQNQTKKFLEEACTLIELGNIVESFRLGHLKLCEPCICNDNIATCKKAGRESADERAFAAWLKTEARHQVPRRTRPTLSYSRAAKGIRKTNEARPCETFDLNKKSLCKLQSQLSEVHKDSNRLKREPKKFSRKRQSLPPCSEKDKNVPTKVKERQIKRQLNAKNIDKCMQYLLKDLSSHVNSGKTSIALLPKTDYSKCRLHTWKSFTSFSDTLLFNKACMKQKTNKKDKADGVGKRQVIKSADSKPSLELKIRLNPNSNTMNLLIKSRQGTCGSAISNSDAINFHLPFQCNSSVSNAVNKLSTNFSSSLLTERSVQTPSAQTSKNREIRFLKPYAKTQAVYQVYDVAPYQQPTGKMKGIRSHISFNVNIGGSPGTPQGRMYADEGRPLTAPPSGRLAGNRQVLYNNKVNLDSGSTSMQQSFSLRRSDPQSESPYETDEFSRVCDCANSGRSSMLDTQQSDSPVCETCYQANALQRTRQRIIDRVGTDPSYGRSMIFSPLVFLKKCYDKYICNKVEEQTKSVGSCTCSPFIETEQFTVQEGNVNPECSLLKRCFGQLIFNNKCVVCTEEKRVGTKYRPLKTYECEPGTCVEKKDFLGCLKKLCKKKEPKPVDKKKAKEKAKKAKLKQRKTKEKKKIQEKRKREKLKGTSRSSFITSVFKNPEEDDDRQKLLPDEGKKKYRKNGDKEKDGKGKEGATSELEEKAKKTLATTRRGYRRITRRIRERYYRNKKLAEEQKGQYACDFYLMSLRTKPCLWVYYMCPVCYPYCLQLLNTWRQVSDLLLFFVAIIVWSPCILCAECLKVVACNMCVS
ncbi:uncharacterized protein LOC133534689 isoform X2 [Cydia pomonella]|nr:uncharacterized protein LOC133534689 isoform X2 [Cydia pomonella]XP_061729921.1 uncharacterized protein LOC133534689 isoform X2 [Cydia pomonella]